ncbi:phosphate-starvation-inducible PsiE family protein [Geobacter sp. 60473]|uniref:phosphate-starvation-inducible PsiE family protein n=1 Tax=Geobacter sp. 60473 TaxID=3080755 RepID=UPI002B2CAECF|nr:phosphate-starvation-inducible PsiE family protein [Geobacter sp. 60473]
MITQIKKFEKMIIFSLVVMMALVLFLATLELAWIIVKDIVSPPFLLLEIDELLEIFGLFMLVLIGIELLETIAKTYLAQSTDHARIVMAVAIIAIARKVIILDVKDLSGQVLLGIAAIILALSIGYYLIRGRSGGLEREGDTPSEPERL